MVFENLQVKHKSFGDGTVIEYDGKYMSVKFTSAVKKFVYPDAFENFLSLVDAAYSSEVANDIAVAKKAKQDIIDKKHEENLRAMTKGIVIPGKEFSAGDSDEDESKSGEAEEI